jgi:tripartite ATP-independent transporter DctM subunit
MDLGAIALVVLFVIFLVMNMPVAYAIAMATCGAFFVLNLSGGDDLPAATIIAQKMVSGIDSFALLAIPFFILSGLLMGQGGLARRLFDFVNVFMGHFPGGLAYVNIATSMLFGSISGSAAASVSSVGGMMMPEMKRHGYGDGYNVAVSTTSAITGLMIPPSNAVIVYALAAGSVSISAMFIAGILPGILFGLLLMVVAGILAVKHGYHAGEKQPLSALFPAFLRAVPSLLLVVIILGGILAGIVTPTEAAAVAVLYSFILTVVIYREVKPSDIPGILLKCAKTTSIVMFLIGASMAMSWLLTYRDIPQSISAGLFGISENPIVLLLLMNVVLLAVGTFMDLTPAVLIFTPIFLPVAESIGLSPIHFGMMLIANLCIGLCTPPVGTCLFVGCSVGKTTLSEVVPKMVPFFIAMIVALLLVTFCAPISEWLPTALGLMK